MIRIAVLEPIKAALCSLVLADKWTGIGTADDSSACDVRWLRGVGESLLNLG